MLRASLNIAATVYPSSFSETCCRHGEDARTGSVGALPGLLALRPTGSALRSPAGRGPRFACKRVGPAATRPKRTLRRSQRRAEGGARPASSRLEAGAGHGYHLDARRGRICARGGEGADLLIAEGMYVSEENKPARWESLHMTFSCKPGSA